MNYQIMVVTKKYYNTIHNTFRQQYDRHKYRGARDFGELHLEGLTVRIRRSVKQTCGYKFHVIYADEEILENKELVDVIFKPMLIFNNGNGLFPLTESTLTYVFGIKNNEQLDETKNEEI